MSCGIGHRYGSDPMLLWLWCRPVAVAQIRPQAWEPPYAVGTALKTKNKKQTNKQKLRAFLLLASHKYEKRKQNFSIKKYISLTLGIAIDRMFKFHQNLYVET